MNRREWPKVVLAGAVAFALPGCMIAGLDRNTNEAAFAGSGEGHPPNFIVILSDDHGWTGTSVAMDPNNPASKSDFY